jgi:hypothetical protein
MDQTMPQATVPARLAGFGIVLAASLWLVTGASAEVVGTAAAVNPASSGGDRTLVIGAQVIRNERIKTDAAGSVQLLFLDRTTMSVGPNSDLVIDNYVFDPNKGAGSMALTVGKGLIRFVGGQVTHSGEAVIQTPSAVIGIRGGTGQISVDGGQVRVTFLGSNGPGGGIAVAPCQRKTDKRRRPCEIPQFGVSIASLFGATLINRADFSTLIAAGLDKIPEPGRVDPQTLQAENAQLGSRPGSGDSGGAGGKTAAEASDASNGPGGDVASKGIVPGDGSGQPPSGNGIGDAADQAATINQTIAATESAQKGIFALEMTRCCDPAHQTSVVPYLPAGFAADGDSTPLLGFQPANSADPAVTLQWGAGDTWFYVATGDFIPDGHGGLVYSGAFRAFPMSFGSGGAFEDLASGFISSPSGGVQVDPVTRLPTGGTVNQDRFVPELNAYVPSHADIGGGGNPFTDPPTSYDFTQNFHAITPPAGLGAYRPAATLNGFVGGLIQTAFPDGSFTAPYALTNLHDLASDVAIALNPATGRLQANFNVRSVNPPGGGISSAAYQFGSLTGSLGRSAYIDYDNFGAIEAVTIAKTSATSVDTTPVSQIDGQPLVSHLGAMVVINNPFLASGGPFGNLSDDDFPRFGVWATDSNQFNQFDDRGNAMFWVAGQKPSAADIPISGVATYQGLAIANIANGGDQYSVSGGFSNTVNFGTRTGAVAVTNFDGRNYAGGMVIDSGDPTAFLGGLTSSGSDRAMVLNGSFFKGKTDPVGQMGGGLTVAGHDYLGSGIFAAQKTHP